MIACKPGFHVASLTVTLPKCTGSKRDIPGRISKFRHQLKVQVCTLLIMVYFNLILEVKVKKLIYNSWLCP